MSQNQIDRYEERYIKLILEGLVAEDKKKTKHKKQTKGEYLVNGVKACKKLNRQLKRPTFDR